MRAISAWFTGNDSVARPAAVEDTHMPRLVDRFTGVRDSGSYMWFQIHNAYTATEVGIKASVGERWHDVISRLQTCEDMPDNHRVVCATPTRQLGCIDMKLSVTSTQHASVIEVFTEPIKPLGVTPCVKPLYKMATINFSAKPTDMWFELWFPTTIVFVCVDVNAGETWNDTIQRVCALSADLDPADCEVTLDDGKLLTEVDRDAVVLDETSRAGISVRIRPVSTSPLDGRGRSRIGSLPLYFRV